MNKETARSRVPMTFVIDWAESRSRSSADCSTAPLKFGGGFRGLRRTSAYEECQPNISIDKANAS